MTQGFLVMETLETRSGREKEFYHAQIDSGSQLSF
jgi:hypothetical protein